MGESSLLNTNISHVCIPVRFKYPSCQHLMDDLRCLLAVKLVNQISFVIYLTPQIDLQGMPSLSLSRRLIPHWFR